MSSSRSGSIDEHASSVESSKSSPATAASASVELRSRLERVEAPCDQLGDRVGNRAGVERARVACASSTSWLT